MIKMHIIELLTEANKKISNVISISEENTKIDTQKIINDINDVISQLDSIVEQLEKNNQ